MPFTFSHAVLAPPLSKLTGNRLPIGALAIGTMTPDFYRILVQKEIHLNHQWQGLVHPDLWVGLLFCFLWYCLYRPMLFKLVGIHAPLNIHSAMTLFKFLCGMILAILLGTATHIIWDGLTHLDFRTFAFHAFLAREVPIMGHIYPMHRVLQIGTSIVALPFLLWMSLHYYSNFRQPNITSKEVFNFAFILFLFSFFAGSTTYILRAKYTGFNPHSADLYTLIGFFLNGFARGSLLCFTLGCIVFLWLDRKQFFKE